MVRGDLTLPPLVDYGGQLRRSATGDCRRSPIPSRRHGEDRRHLCAQAAPRSLLGQPRLAQRVDQLRAETARQQELDAELGIDSKRFGNRCLRVVHLAFEHVRGSKIQVRPNGLVSGVDRLVVFFDRGVQMSEAEFGIRQQIVIPAHSRIAWTEKHGLLQVGFRLFELTQK